MMNDKTIAVLIPCYNEVKTIGKVIQDFRRELPIATIYVYDNNSQDDTFRAAMKAGAIVRKETRQGKGNVVRTMFRDIDADYYVLVDGDDTYPSENIHALLTMAENGIDMAVGDRLSNGAYAKENERRFHAIGNDLVKALINKLFGVSLRDIMSGYRVFSQRFVKLYPVLCEGFQLETDMTIFALSRRLSLGEVPIKYRNRPQGSTSKLNTFSDGIRVIVAIFNLYRFFHPIRFFGSLSVLFFLCGLFVGLPVIIEFMETHYIQKVPSAILASGIMILSILSFFNGLVLDANKRSEQEQFERDLKRLHTSKLSRSIT